MRNHCHHQLHSEFEASLVHMRSCLNQKRKPERLKWSLEGAIQFQLFGSNLFCSEFLFCQFQSITNVSTIHFRIWTDSNWPISSICNDSRTPRKWQHVLELLAEWHPRAGTHAHLDHPPTVPPVSGFHSGQLHNSFHHQDRTLPPGAYVPLPVHAGSDWPVSVSLHPSDSARHILGGGTRHWSWCLLCPALFYPLLVFLGILCASLYGVWSLCGHLPPFALCFRSHAHSDWKNRPGLAGPQHCIHFSVALYAQAISLLWLPSPLAFLLSPPRGDEIGLCRHQGQQHLRHVCHCFYSGGGLPAHPFLLRTHPAYCVFHCLPGWETQSSQHMCFSHLCCTSVLYSHIWLVCNPPLWKADTPSGASGHGLCVSSRPSCDEPHCLQCQDQTDPG